MKKLKLKSSNFTQGLKKAFINSSGDVEYVDTVPGGVEAVEIPDVDDTYYVTSGKGTLVVDYKATRYWKTSEGTSLTRKKYYDGPLSTISNYSLVSPVLLGYTYYNPLVERYGKIYTALLNRDTLHCLNRDFSVVWSQPISGDSTSYRYIEFLDDYIIIFSRQTSGAIRIELFDYDGNVLDVDDTSIVLVNFPSNALVKNLGNNICYARLHDGANGGSYEVDVSSGAIVVTSIPKINRDFTRDASVWFLQDETKTYSYSPFDDLVSYRKSDYSLAWQQDFGGDSAQVVQKIPGTDKLVALIYPSSTIPRLVELDANTGSILRDVSDSGAPNDSLNSPFNGAILDESTFVYFNDRNTNPDAMEIVWFDLPSWSVRQRQTTTYHNGGMTVAVPTSFSNSKLLFVVQYNGSTGIAGNYLPIMVDSTGYNVPSYTGLEFLSVADEGMFIGTIDGVYAPAYETGNYDWHIVKLT